MVSLKSLACLCLASVGIAQAQKMPWIPINLPVPNSGSGSGSGSGQTSCPTCPPPPACPPPSACPPPPACPSTPAIDPADISKAKALCDQYFPGNEPLFRANGEPYGCAPNICSQPGVTIKC